MLDLENLILNIDEQLADVTDTAALVEQQAAAEREEVDRYLLVGIAALHLAIAIDDLSEVGPFPTLTLLPNLPSWIQGIVNIRSEIVSVIDFGGFLNIAGRGLCDGNRLVTLRHKKRKIGIRVDRIIGTVSKSLSETQPLDPVEKKSVDASLFSSSLFIDKNFYYILNVPRFLSASRLVDYNKKE
jgi:purine-binding chemotaxis protein CheW